MPHIGNHVDAIFLPESVNTSTTLRINGGDLHLDDGKKALFGQGDDLQIYHDGLISYISDQGTGALRILASDVRIRNAADNEEIATFAQNGAVELYYDGGKKFETASTGIDVTGNNIRVLGPTSGLTFTTSTLTLRGFRQSVGGQFGNVDFKNIDANSANTEYLAARISAQIPDGADGGELKFFVTPHNSTTLNTTPSLILHDDSSAEFTGAVKLGDNDKIKLGDDDDLEIYHEGLESVIKDDGPGPLKLLTNKLQVKNSGDAAMIAEFKSGTNGVDLYYDSFKKFETTSTGATVTGTALATALSTGAAGTGINISTDTITGPATLTIDPAAIGDDTGLVVIKGNFQVDGTTTTINSTTMTVDDLNLTLASGAANSAAADGAGITIDGASATLTYNSTPDAWSFNKDLEVSGGDLYVNSLDNSEVDIKLGIHATHANFGLIKNVRASDSQNYLSFNIHQGLSGYGLYEALQIHYDEGLYVRGFKDYSTTAYTGNVSHVLFGDQGEQFADIVVESESASSRLGAFVFKTKGSSGIFPLERLRITSAGNVGIGVTDPKESLQVSGEIVQSSNNALMGNLYFDSGWKYVGNGSGGALKWHADHMQFITAANNTSGADASASPSTSMVLTPTGNLGIGTTDPDRKLHVNGDTRLDGIVQIGDGTSTAYQLNIETVDSGNNDNTRGGARLDINGWANDQGTKYGMLMDIDTLATDSLSSNRSKYGLYIPYNTYVSENAGDGDTMAGTFNQNFYGQYIHLTLDDNEVSTYNAGKANQVYGYRCRVRMDHGGGAIDVRGIYSQVQIANDFNSTSNTIDKAYAAYNHVVNDSDTTTFTAAYGTYSWVNQDNNGTMTDAYGVYSRVDRDAGTGTNAYGLYSAIQGTWTGLKYGVYSEGETSNYFSGNVGIGTTAPTEKLHVTGNLKVEGTAPQIKLAETGVTGNPSWWLVQDAGNLSFRNNNTTPYPFRIITKGTNSDTTDFVSFGGDTIQDALTLTAHGTSPTYLDLKGNSANARMRYFEDSTERWNIGYDTSNNAFTFYDTQSAAVRLALKDGGNVGIGTTSPLAKLHVYGAGALIDPAGNTTAGDQYDSMVIGNRPADDGYASLSFKNGANFSSKIDVTQNFWSVWTSKNSQSQNRIEINWGSSGTASEVVKLRPGGTDVLTAKGDGNVGIGTNAPTEKLEVDGVILSSGPIVDTVWYKETWPAYNETTATLAGNDLGTWTLTDGTLLTGTATYAEVDTANLPSGLKAVRWKGVGSVVSYFTSPTIDLSDFRTNERITTVNQTGSQADRSVSDSRIYLTMLLAAQSMDSSAEHMEVQISKDNGVTFYEHQAFVWQDNDEDNTDNTDTTWRKVVIDVSEYTYAAALDVGFKIRFVGTGTGGGDSYGVSNIYIHDAPIPNKLKAKTLKLGDDVISASGDSNYDNFLEIVSSNNTFKGLVLNGDVAAIRDNYVGVDGADSLVLAADERDGGNNSRIDFRIDAKVRAELYTSTSATAEEAHFQLIGGSGPSDRSNWRMSAYETGSTGYFAISDYSGGSWNTNLAITESGKVGIGTDDPDTKLQIDDVTPELRLNSTDGTLRRMSFSGSGSNIWYLKSFGLDATYNNSFEIAQGSNSRLFLQSGGNVGVGTSNPTTKLEIEAGTNTTTDYPLTITNNSVNYGMQFGAYGASNASFGASNIDYSVDIGGDLVVNTSGLGINISTIARGPLHIHQGTTGDTQIHMTNSETGTSSTDGFTIFTGGSTGSHSGFVNREASARIRFLMHPSGGSSVTDQMVLLADGNLGLGISDPTRKLHVFGSSLFGGTVAAGRAAEIDTNGQGFFRYDDNNLTVPLTIENRATNAVSGHGCGIRFRFGDSASNDAHDAGRIVFLQDTSWTSNANTHDAKFVISLAQNDVLQDRLVIAQNGTITMGTQEIASNGIEVGRGSGSVAMTINDGYGNANITFNHREGTPDNTSADQSAGRIECTVDGAGGRMYFELKDSTSNGVATSLTEVLDLDIGLVEITGDLDVSGTLSQNTSDGRLKENLVRIPTPLDRVDQLHGYTFDWKAECADLGFTPKIQTNDIGLIAQDVQAVMPQAVAPAPFDHELSEDGTEDVSISGENYLTVQYERLVPLLVEAIKELRQEVEGLKAQISGS